MSIIKGFVRLSAMQSCGCAHHGAYTPNSMCHNPAAYACIHMGITMPICRSCAQRLCTAYVAASRPRANGICRLEIHEACGIHKPTPVNVEHICGRRARYAFNYGGIVLTPICRTCAQDLAQLYRRSASTEPTPTLCQRSLGASHQEDT